MAVKNRDIRFSRTGIDGLFEFTVGLDDGPGTGDVIIRLSSGDVDAASLDNSTVPASTVGDAAVEFRRLVHDGVGFVGATEPSLQNDGVVVKGILVPYPLSDYEPANRLYVDGKQAKDPGAVDGNIAVFDSEQTVDSGIDVADLVTYSDPHLANSVWANPTGNTAPFADFQVTPNSVVARADGDIVNVGIAVEQVLGRFLGPLTALDQVEVNDGGHSTTRNNVNGMLHWTMGTRYRAWDTVTLAPSLVDASVVGVTFFSGSGAAPNSTTNHFLKRGSLKPGMNVKVRLYASVKSTDDATFKLRYNSTNVGSVTVPAGTEAIVNVDCVVTSVSPTAGGLKVFYDTSNLDAVYASSTTLDTVSDATLDVVVDTGATAGTRVEVEFSEIIIAG